MKIALAQINPTVGDISGNVHRIRQVLSRAAKQGADLVVYPELSLTGYPPRDLVEQPAFVEQNREALRQLAAVVTHPAIIVGYIDKNPTSGEKPLWNAAALLHKRRIVATRMKTLLPTYDVFDEGRHFAPAHENKPISFLNHRIGLTICEDMWHVPAVWPDSPYKKDPIAALVRQGANLLINISCSPFHGGKPLLRRKLIEHHVNRWHRPFVFVNQVGGNDEVLFDGHSFAMGEDAQPITQANGFEEELLICDTKQTTRQLWRNAPELEDIRDALVMGIRDYTSKCGFKQVVLGLSGGIDSAVTAALAVHALGAENVLGVLMPSPFSSRGSVVDALDLCKRLGIRHHTIPITPIFSAFKKSLRQAFAGKRPDVAEENLQARIRGTLLMALSNKFGMLLLTTGNKSELSMGYCTLYGDMNGGLAVISDVPKTMVYKLGRLLNRPISVIPEASFTKPPSAELRPNQTDQDSLPPYDVLDAIMEAYVGSEQDVEDIVLHGHAKPLVERILRTIDRNEYKRRQAAPGLRISAKAFGMGRRMPIARGDFRR